MLGLPAGGAAMGYAFGAAVITSLSFLLLNIGINTIWVMQMVGKAYLVLLPPRTWKNLVLLPVEVFLIFAVFKTVQAVERRYALGRSAGK